MLSLQVRSAYRGDGGVVSPNANAFAGTEDHLRRIYDADEGDSNARTMLNGLRSRVKKSVRRFTMTAPVDDDSSNVPFEGTDV